MGPLSPGGDGTGILALLVFVLLSVFIAGLMVGRLPEYLGKKSESHEIKIVTLARDRARVVILGTTALAVVSPQGLAGPGNTGPHGFSEILYALDEHDQRQWLGLRQPQRQHALVATFWVSVVMLAGRLIPAIGMLALAGSMAARQPGSRQHSERFQRTGVTFGALLLGVR